MKVTRIDDSYSNTEAKNDTLNMNYVKNQVIALKWRSNEKNFNFFE